MQRNEYPKGVPRKSTASRPLEKYVCGIGDVEMRGSAHRMHVNEALVASSIQATIIAERVGLHRMTGAGDACATLVAIHHLAR